MSAPTSFTPLLAALDREIQSHRATLTSLERLHEAARAQRIAGVTEAIGAVAPCAERMQRAVTERERAIRVLGSERSLRSLAERRGAPSVEILARRDALREAAAAVDAKVRRLQPLLRELGQIYSAAIATLLLAARDAASDPEQLDGSAHLVNAEA